MNTQSLWVEIQVKEELDEQWADYFQGLRLTRTGAGLTLFAGALPDRSALHGALNQLRNLNLSLVSVLVTECAPTHSGTNFPEETELK